jgi:hypothetical protein
MHHAGRDGIKKFYNQTNQQPNKTKQTENI